MGKNASRFGVLGFALVSTAALSFPGSAAAETLSGDCATTLPGVHSRGLALDLGAPLNAPGLLIIGLDSQSTKGAPRLSLPVGDAVRALGLGNVPTVKGLCDTAQGTVNAVGDTTQGLLGGGGEVNPPGTPAPGPGTPDNPGSPVPPPTGPGAPPVRNPGDSASPVVMSPDVPSAGDSIAGIFVNGAISNGVFIPDGLGAPVIIPMVTPEVPAIDGLVVPPVVIADRSGTAQALPAANSPARLPLLLAVVALAVVAAALTRTWLRRNPSA
jgi:hypothetical protein